MYDAVDWLIQVLLLVGCFLIAGAAYFVARLVYKARNAGSFNVAYRGAKDSNWVAGVCHYSEDLLKWYRIISLRWGSSLRWPRNDFEILDSQTVSAEGKEISVLHCESAGQNFYLAMDWQDYSGLVSWKESAPPRG